jgi:hypothetical protein
VSTHHDLVRDDPFFQQLRGWQKDAFFEYFRLPRRDFLLVATPGAGKTAYALTVAAQLLARREVATVTIVTPTEHLKHQWAEAASQFGIAIDSKYQNAQGRAGADFIGVAVTYAQVAAHPALHRQRTENRRTLVVFDEIHHAGDALPTPAAPPSARPPVTRQHLAVLRKELNGLVGAWSHRTGQPHGVIHAELRQVCGGPPLPQATADQIQARIAKIRSWALSGC